MIGKNKGLVILCLLLFLAAFSYSFIVGREDQKGDTGPGDSVREPGIIGKIGGDSKEREMRENNGFVLEKGALINKITRYSHSGEISIVQQRAGDDLSGAGFEEIRQLFSDWLIRKFTVDELELYREVEGVSPRAASAWYLVLKEDKLILYKGPPDYNGNIEGTYNISLELLPPGGMSEKELAELMAGKMYESRDDALKVVEGYLSMLD